MLERPHHLAGGAHVHPDERRLGAHEPQEPGVALRLEGEPDPEVEPGGGHRVAQRERLLAGGDEVVREHRGGLGAGDVLGVTARDQEPPVTYFQPGSFPPRPALRPHRARA